MTSDEAAFPRRTVLVWAGDPQADAAATDMRAAGIDVAVLATEAPVDGAHAPLQVVLSDASASGWLARHGGAPGVVPSVFGAPPDEAAMSQWLSAGVVGWWPSQVLAEPVALRAALTWDWLRWQRERDAQAETSRIRGQLDERKWVDRAKGVLMSARGIGEDEAFRILRGAAMHANLRVGEVSRSVIEASQWAELVNRAGQLRMLSQRLLKLAAQRHAGVDARRARAMQDEAAQRVEDNLAQLGASALMAGAPDTAGAALADVTACWARLRHALAQRPSPPSLAEADRCAEELLDGAETLTSWLEQGGARRALRLVNLCGRQRMRVQRVAKAALLADLLGDPARRDTLAPLLDDFTATLQELERAPLSSAETHDALAMVRDEWLRLLRGIDTSDRPEGRALLCASSDALLDAFDRLTAGYEHSLQVIMS